MIVKHFEHQETQYERIQRLRKSVEWFNEHGDTPQEIIYRAKLVTAERRYLLRASTNVGISRSRIRKRMKEMGVDDPLAAALDLVEHEGFLEKKPD